jgi:hypothetical protein
MGYEAGPVHRLDVAGGRIEEALFTCPAKALVVADDGRVIFARPRGDAGGSREDGPEAKAIEIAAYDPEARKVTVVGTAPAGGRTHAAGEAPPGFEWFKGQDGQRVLHALCGRAVLRVDTAAGRIERAGEFDGPLGPGDAAFRDGVAWKLSMIGSGQGTNRAVELMTLHLASGRTRRHGIIVDREGRLAQELWALDVGDDGTAWVAGCVYPRAGDAYAPRLKRYFLNENRLLRIRGVER